MEYNSLYDHIIQGGPAPCFLSKEAFGYVVDVIDNVSTDDWIPKVHNEKYKGAIEEVTSCSTDEELRQVLMKDDILYVLSFIGYRGVPSKETLSSKEAMLRPIVMTEFQIINPILDLLRMSLESFCTKQQGCSTASFRGRQNKLQANKGSHP